MISVAEHLDSIRRQVRPLEAVSLPLGQAAGLVAAADVTSPVDLPRFDNSAMDGYVGVAAELAEAGPEHPMSVVVSGDIAAGDPGGQAHVPGQVWRIMTGAPMPAGADAIIPVEDTDGRPREVLIRKAPTAGRHLRRAGEDLRTGEVIVPRGTPIGPAQIAVLASAGIVELEVISPVRVTVLTTGDELVPVGEPVGPGQIPDSNGPMLVAAVRAAGCFAVHAGHLSDDEGEVKAEIHRHLEHADVVLTTGGVSKGAFDPVKAVLTGEGSMWFGEVAMQPGKPQGFGLLGKREVPVFTLPGNPVSALVSFEVFVRPALLRLAGRVATSPSVQAVVLEGWTSPEGKEQYARVRLGRDAGGGYAAEPAGGAGSHLVGGLAAADGLAVVPPEVTEVAVGSQVTVLPLRPLAEIDGRIDQEHHRDE